MQIPRPPNDVEKYLYIKQNKNVLYLMGTFTYLTLITGMTIFVIQHPLFYWYGLFVALLFVYLGLSYFIGIFSREWNQEAHNEILTTFKEYRPTVDVYLPCCGEDIDIIRNTHAHVALLDYPKDKLKVFVLDDRGQPEVEASALLHGFEYISRPNKGELKKAGNIRYAFARTDGEIMLILDADFVPRPDMLRELVPYFALDSKVAIVQSPQYFTILPDDPWVQKGAAFIQELFYRVIQVSRAQWGASICVGTCAAYRRSALAPHGGTAAIAYSEDMHTGFQALEDGLKVVYIPVNISKGVCPDTIQAFLMQQYRWCTGSFTLFMTARFWKAKIPFMAKLTYLSGMLYYLATAFGLIFVPIPGLMMLIYFPEHIYWYNAVFSIPSFIFGTIGVAVWSRAPFGWYAMRTRTISYFAHLLAIYDKVKGQTVAWVATGDLKLSTGTELYQRFLKVFWWWVLLTTVPQTVLVILLVDDLPWYNFIPSLFFVSLQIFINYKILLEIRKNAQK